MFVLHYKFPKVVREGKSGYYMGYTWKQYAMCEEREPLQEIIDTQKHPDEWKIEEFPSRPA